MLNIEVGYVIMMTDLQRSLVHMIQCEADRFVQHNVELRCLHDPYRLAVKITHIVKLLGPRSQVKVYINLLYHLFRGQESWQARHTSRQRAILSQVLATKGNAVQEHKIEQPYLVRKAKVVAAASCTSGFLHCMPVLHLFAQKSKSAHTTNFPVIQLSSVQGQPS